MKANSKYTKVFSVGLQTGLGGRGAHSTKGTHYAGGQVLSFANTFLILRRIIMTGWASG